MDHETKIWTRVTFKKISCYVPDSACRCRIVENPKIFWSYEKNFWNLSRVKNAESRLVYKNKFSSISQSCFFQWYPCSFKISRFDIFLVRPSVANDSLYDIYSLYKYSFYFDYILLSHGTKCNIRQSCYAIINYSHKNTFTCVQRE